MDPQVRARIEATTGRPIDRVDRIRGGGYTPADRWRVTFTDGGSAFAKVGTTPLTSRWVRDEHRWYTALADLQSDLLARCVGFSDDPVSPVLVLEDLSAARWPPPWEPGDVDRVRAAVRRMSAHRPLPADLPPLESLREKFRGWTEIARDPGPFLSLGRCSPEWLERALPALVEAESSADLDGDDLLHLDLRSDNLCLLGDRVVLVDWNHPVRGPGAVDPAFFAPSLRMEGGPFPAPDPYAPLVAGYFASQAGLPDIPDALRVRWIQRRQLAVALPWAARSLGLPPPDSRWAQVAIDAVARRFGSGEVDRAGYHAEVEEALIDAYLSTDDPRAMSGKSGDEADWRWSRELALDAAPCNPVALLDVGCANGYLLDSLVRWGAERGLVVDPWGLEISDRMARVAREARPALADRIAVGNVVDWVPPRRFDLVHTGLDYVPVADRRDLVVRILRDLVRPGGRLVIRAERAGPDDPVAQLAALGFPADGVVEAVHPVTGVVRRTAWIVSADRSSTGFVTGEPTGGESGPRSLTGDLTGDGSGDRS